MEVGEEEDRVEEGAGDESMGSHEETGWLSSSMKSSRSWVERLHVSGRSRSASS